MLYYLCFGRYCSRAHCAQFWRQLWEAQLWLLLSAGQRCSATETRGCGGRLETCPTFQAYQGRSASSSRHSPTRCMECESGTHSIGFPPCHEGDFLGEREKSEGVDGRNALQWILGSVCADQCHPERHRNLRAGTEPEWLYAEPSTLPASAWRHPRTVPEHGTTGKKCEKWWNEARFGGGGTCTASRSETMVAAQSRCGSVRCAPSDAQELQVVAQIASSTYDGACKWKGRRDDPTILHDRRRKNVVTTRLGLAVRVKTTDFEEVVKLVQPEN